MPRRGFILAVAGLFATVAVVGFLAGFLGARGETPARGDVTLNPVTQGGASFFAEVLESGNNIVVRDDSGEEHRFTADDVTISASTGASLDDLQPGALVILVLETDVFGGQAVRYVILVPEEAQARAR